jgi:hypothetical protein
VAKKRVLKNWQLKEFGECFEENKQSTKQRVEKSLWERGRESETVVWESVWRRKKRSEFVFAFKKVNVFKKTERMNDKIFDLEKEDEISKRVREELRERVEEDSS